MVFILYWGKNKGDDLSTQAVIPIGLKTVFLMLQLNLLKITFSLLDGILSHVSKLIRNFFCLGSFCSCTSWFVSDLVRNPKRQVFSQPSSYEPHTCDISLFRRELPIFCLFS